MVAIITPVAHASGTTDVNLEPEWMVWTPSGNMSTYSNSAASGGPAVKITANASGIIGGTTSAMTGVYVIASGDQCSGAPTMQVKLDGTVVGTQSVTSTAWKQYRYPASVSAGYHSLEIAFTNQFSSGCTRALNVDMTGFATPGSSAPASGAKLVSLGDSYSSGMGTDKLPLTSSDMSVYDPATTTSSNQCYRSIYAPSHLLAYSSRNYTLYDTSCAGASTDYILTLNQYNESPQISQVTSDTDLITVTIGGNDVQLLTFIDCAASSECTSSSSTVQTINSKIATLQDKISAVLTAIKQKAPHSQVLIAGYPYSLPQPGVSAGNCASVLSSAEQTLFKQIIDSTNGAIQTAAAAAGGNVTYVDPNASGSPFMATDSNGLSLDACSTSNQRLFNGPTDGSTTAWWHPNGYGANAYYNLYNSAL
jgi:outer membrane murein-binding lipoprotein Lpp